jgi:acetylornithine deacetylase
MEKIRQRVLECVHEERVIELAKNLIRIPSFTGEEKEVAEFAASYLENMGLEVEGQEVGEGANVIGTLRGKGGGSSLIFNGHLDIDAICGEWVHDPFDPLVENGRLYGLGSSNMKGGDAAFIEAVNAIKDAKVELKGDVVVTLVMGELTGGKGTLHMLKKGVTADAAVVTEPTGLAMGTVSCGITRIKVHAYGRTVHVSQKEQGISAIEKMAKVVDGLSKAKFPRSTASLKLSKGFIELGAHAEDYPRMVIGVIRGGVGSNYYEGRPSTVPDLCTITIDVRFGPRQSVDTIINDIEDTIGELRKQDPQLRAKVELDPTYVEGGYRPTFDLPKDEHIVKAVQRSHECVTGGKPVFSPPGVWRLGAWGLFGGQDGAWMYTRYGIPSVIYGPSGGSRLDPSKNVDVPDLYVNIDEIAKCARTLALTAVEFCNKTKGEIVERTREA